MPIGERMEHLVNSYYNQDEESFNRLVVQLAESETRRGNVNIAQNIKQIADKKSLRNNKITNLNEINEQIEYKKISHLTLSDLIVNESISQRLSRVIHEYTMRKKINAFGLTNRRKILLVGPPGTGKTMTAEVLSAELNMNLGVIELDNVIMNNTGVTSSRLIEIFHTINLSDGVYLFDRLDVIASHKNQSHDAGEMRRVVHSFLQSIEQDQTESIIIATTNDLNAIDKETRRRFDDIIFYEKPNVQQIRTLIQDVLKLFVYELDISVVVKYAEGLNHAEITKACGEAIKTQLLYDEKITQDLLIRFIEERKAVCL